MPDTASISTRYLQNLWDEARSRAAGDAAARTAPLPVESARRRSAHHELRRRQYELEVHAAGSADRRAGPRAGGEGQRRRSAIDRHVRLRHAVSGQARTADRALPRRSARRRDGRASIRCARSARIASPRRSIRRCTRSCRSTTSIICIPDWASPWRRAPTARRKLDGVQRALRPAHRLGAVAAARLRAGHDAAPRGRGAPGCDGILLGSHGLFTWGDTQHDCYVNSIKTIDQMGEFVEDHARRVGTAAVRRAGGDRGRRSRRDRRRRFCRMLRGAVSSNRRVIAHFDRSDEALSLRIHGGPPNSASWARAVRIISCGPASARCSCRGIPRSEDVATLQQRIAERLGGYRDEYVAYYTSCAQAGFAGAARLEPVGGRDSRRSASSASARTSARRGSRRSSSSTRSTSWRAHGARETRPAPLRAAAGAHGGAGRGVHELSQLRRVAEERSLPHRVLGARGGEAAADAAGARVQPEDRAGRRRRQRDRPRGRAAAGAARRARRRRRSR